MDKYVKNVKAKIVQHLWR